MYNLRFVNLDPGAAIATPDGAGALATKSKFQPGVYELASAIEGGSVWVSELLDAKEHLAQPTVLSELLDTKADPNCCLPPQDWWVPDLCLYDQYTPLHMVINRLDGAEWEGSEFNAKMLVVPDCVKLLVEHEADLNLVDAWGQTPLQALLQHWRLAQHLATSTDQTPLASGLAASASCAEAARVVKLCEQSMEIMGAEAMAARRADAQKQRTFPWCP